MPLKKTVFALAIVPLAFLSACTPSVFEEKRWTHIACVVDATRSIEPQARKEAFDELEKMADSIERKTRVTVIPVSGDAANEGGSVHLSLADKREVHDADKVKFARLFKEGIGRIRAASDAGGFLHSDVIGAIKIAGEEMAQGSAEERKILLVLTDFIQDDARFRFLADPRFNDESQAAALGRAEGARLNGAFCGAHVRLGSLRSGDLRRAAESRRRGIAAFWTAYFTAAGASDLEFRTDGIGNLSEAIAPKEKI